MKKNIAFLLALMLLLSLCLTGCGGKNELAAEENDPAVSESEGKAITIDDKGLASWEPVEGVRIYHINALMEKRVLHGSDGVDYPIGTPHFVNAFNEDGKYQVELIQAGGVNTFTDTKKLRTALDPEDFFYAGDSFTLQSHGAFFKNGLMDDGSDFGYRIEILSIENDANGEPTATIRITR